MSAFLVKRLEVGPAGAPDSLPFICGYQAAAAHANAGRVFWGTRDVPQAGRVVLCDRKGHVRLKWDKEGDLRASLEELGHQGHCQPWGEEPAGTRLKDAGGIQPHPTGSIQAGARSGNHLGSHHVPGQGVPMWGKGVIRRGRAPRPHASPGE